MMNNQFFDPIAHLPGTTKPEILFYGGGGGGGFCGK